jgi:hypothetical protein
MTIKHKPNWSRLPTRDGGLMRLKQKRAPATIALTLVLALTQVYFGLAFAAVPAGFDSRVSPQQISGILTTQDNKTITVNGASATTGATILNGAVIETPDGVTATINIPGHGVLTIAANSRLTISLDQSGNIRVDLAQGCAVLHTYKGTIGEMDNAQGVIGKTDGTKDDTIEACRKKVPAGGLTTGAKVAIAAAAIGGGVGLALALGGSSNVRGVNPSASTP